MFWTPDQPNISSDGPGCEDGKFAIQSTKEGREKTLAKIQETEKYLKEWKDK